MEKIEISRSILFFILAGLCEIGGGRYGNRKVYQMAK